MKDENTLYWLWLAQKCGIASKQFGKIIEKYEDPFDVYRLADDEIEQLDGITSALRARLCQKDLESSYAILRYCKENRVDIISYGDRRYPQRLKSIVDPPIVLYCRGHFPDFNSMLCIGIVGTRTMSEYGKQSAYKIGYELAAAGVTVVSGMALGVDATAACGALSVGGCTVAVLGCGISVVYPKEHRRLMGEIAKHGAVITEYSPNEPPYGHNFPKRNRIISGLCQGTLVIEGSSTSGAMITARRAIDQGREVFALPGKIDDSSSDGPNELIREGAYTVLGSDDILKHYDFLYHDVIDSAALSRAKRRIADKDADRALKKYGAGVKRSAVRVSTEDKDDVFIPEKKPQTEQTVNKSKAGSEADDSASMLDSLDKFTRSVFEAMPIDKAISPDSLAAHGFDIGAAVTALTMLELYGLVSSLPGGLYIRK